MTGILLAGGQSKRMGKDKAFLEYKHRKLYEYPLSILTGLCDEILISSNDPRFELTGYQVIPDIFPGQGPMAGIFTCLSSARYPRSLVLGCDLPLMDPRFIQLLVSRSEQNFPVTAGLNKENKPEPLAGIYDKSLLDLMKSLLEEEKNKLRILLEMIPVQYINPTNEGYDPEVIYFNINSPRDIQNLHSH